MRVLLLLLVSVAVCSASEFRFVNVSGHAWTNDAVVFEPGVTVVPMDAYTLPLFSETSADGSQSCNVYFSDAYGEVIEAGAYDESHWWWWGFLVGLGLGGTAFIFRVVRQIGRVSPEV